MNDDYELFVDSLEDALVAIGIDPVVIEYEFPVAEMLRKSQPRLKEPAFSERLAQAQTEYQDQGTTIYGIIKPALKIDGVHWSEDLEEELDWYEIVRGGDMCVVSDIWEDDGVLLYGMCGSSESIDLLDELNQGLGTKDSNPVALTALPEDSGRADSVVFVAEGC